MTSAPTQSKIESEVEKRVSNLSGLTNNVDRLPPAFRLCKFQHIGACWGTVVLYYFEPAEHKFMVQISANEPFQGTMGATTDGLSEAVRIFLDYKDEYLPPDSSFTTCQHIEPEITWWD